MTPNPKTSAIRVGIGGGALLLAGLGVMFLLPDVSNKAKQQVKQLEVTHQQHQAQKQRVQELTDLDKRIEAGAQALQVLQKDMPTGKLGDIQWTVSKTLHEISTKSNVKLQSVKYGQPNREGAKGTNLEAIDVDFVVTGIFQNLKPFMLELERSNRAFAVRDAKLDESPEGARLQVGLRAFREAGVKDRQPEEEGA